MANSANRVISTNNRTDLSRQLMGMLSVIPHSTITAFDEAGKKTGESAVEKLAQTAPRRNQNRAGQWACKKESSGKWVVYNPKHYRLPHLLIKPHQIISHGVNTGKFTKAHDYITPVEQEAIEQFEANFIEAMNQRLEKI